MRNFSASRFVRPGKGAEMRKLTYLFIALALSACSMGGKSEIQRNQQKWQDAGISHYRYNLFVGCFCVFNEDMPLVVEVQDGKVISMEYQSGKEIEATSRELFDQYATIERIFSELEADIHGKADEVTVTYDPTYGFPTKVNIDFIKKAIDDEVALTVSNFEKLP
jgi:uncharacterized protein DUF6174